MQTHHRALIAFLSLTWIGTAIAQPSEEEDLALAYGDKETISIATGSKQALRRAPSVATVITAEDIKNMGAKDLDEVMETVPGIHVTRSASSYTSQYTIQGIGGNPTNPQVLMLQNGIPTNSVFRGDKGQSAGAPLLENIARIEIIRGPGSALYGADAFSGVVNIITRTAENAPGTEFGVRTGSFNSRNAWVQHGSQHGPVDVAAYLQIGRSGGFKEIIGADAATRLDKIFGTRASLAPGSVNIGYNVVDAQLDLGYEKWRLRGGYKLRDNSGTGVGTSYALDPVGKEKTEHINADLSWADAQFARNWGLGFTGNYLQHVEDNTRYYLYPPGAQFPTVAVTDPAVAALLGIAPGATSLTGVFPNGMIGSPGRWERQIRASGYAAYSGFADHSLRFGLGHEDLNIYQIRTIKNFWLNPNGTPVPTGAVMDYSAIQPHLRPHRRFNDYLYAQDEWNFTHDWTLTAGLRRDNCSDFGGTTNPRLALVWDTSYNVTTKLLYGSAFRAPSFNEQYGVNPSGDGNPNLKPERISTLEAAVSWQARNNMQLNLSLFQYNMKDTIRTVAKPSGVGVSYQNTGKQHGSGAELEAVWDASRTLRLTGNYSSQQSIDETTNADAGYAPHHHVFAKADWRFAYNWMFSPQVDRVADRKRATGDTRPQAPDYTTVNLTLHNTQDKGKWDFAVSAYNLFNATIIEPSLASLAAVVPNDLPMAPRSLWLQVTYKP